MDFTDSFRIVNLVVGVLMLLGGISLFFDFGFQNLILGIYIVLFGIMTAFLEFQVPPQFSRYASFMFSFLGRGAFYILIGSILLYGSAWRIAAGSIVAITGLGYCGLEFVPSIEPPANMRDQDAGWGAEQV